MATTPSWAPDEGTDVGFSTPSQWPPQRTAAVLAEAARPIRLAPERDARPWELWHARAIEEGVDEELANLGRAVMRSARSPRLDEDHRAECGWMDDGDDMLELALDDPQAAEERWQALLEHDA